MMRSVTFGRTQFRFNDDLTSDVYIGTAGFGSTELAKNGDALKTVTTIQVPSDDMILFACYYAGLVLGTDIRRQKSGKAAR